MAAQMIAAPLPGTRVNRLVAGLTALLLGTFFIYGAGLSHSEMVHGAAHDSRHTLGFPCH